MRNLVLFGLMSMVAMLILLWPMVSRILAYSYAERYSYYNGGGFVAEISLQFWRMGLMNLVLVGMGLWFSLKKRKMPALPCLAGLEILLSMLLFTRIQNTGSHQMLLFLPGWFLLFCWRSGAGRGHQPLPDGKGRVLGVHAGVCHLGALLSPDHHCPAGLSGGSLPAGSH